MEVENGSGRSAVGNLWEGASQVEEELVGEDYRKQHLAWTSSVSTSWCCQYLYSSFVGTSYHKLDYCEQHFSHIETGKPEQCEA